MHLLSTTTLTGLALLLPNLVTAVPNVTVTRLSNGCAAYPGYNSTTGIAGPWLARADSTGSSEIDGLQLSAASFTNDGTDRFGFVTLPKQAPRLGSGQNITFRCIGNATLQALLPAAQFYPQDPDQSPKYVDLVISTEENWQASFGFNLAPSVPVEGYAHYVGGKRVEGVFLGAAGRTEIMFRYNWGGNAGEYYLVRLNGGVGGLGKRRSLRQKRQAGFPVLDDRDWTGFLKIV